MFIDLGNAMISINSIEGIWKRDLSAIAGKTPSMPYKIVITLKGTDRHEDLNFKSVTARDAMYNIIREKILKGEKVNNG